MIRRLTVDSLITNVRNMLDEDNEANVSDDSILEALNRAQDVAANIISRQYESPLLTSLEVTPTPGQRSFPIPDDAFEQKLMQVEVKVGNYYQQVERVSYRDLHNYDYNTATDVPRAYSIVGNSYELLPATNGTYPLRIWYFKDVRPLVKCQGRVVGTGTDGSGRDYITLDAIGDQLSTTNTELANYINVIDGNTGEVRSTHQLVDIDPSCDRITIKQTPDRTSVLNLTVTGSNSSEIELDDYVSLVTGTCLPFFQKPTSNFIMQRAVLDIRANKLSEGTDALRQLDDELNQQVERTWTGRESYLRVHGRNVNWSRYSRRRWRGGF